MDYILVPSNSKSETSFILDLFEKMHKKATKLTADEIEEVYFSKIIKEVKLRPKGNLDNVKSSLTKIMNK